MNEIRRELERAHGAHTAAQPPQPPKRRRVREWFRRQWLRATSTSR